MHATYQTAQGRAVLGVLAAVILGPVLLAAALVPLFFAGPLPLIAVWWTWISLAPYADVLLVQVAAPVVVALLWQRSLRRQGAKGWA